MQQMGQITRLASFVLPSFHLMGQVGQIITSLYTGSTVALWAPASFDGAEYSKQDATPPIPTPENVIQAMRAARATGVLTVPSFVVSWSHDEEAVQTLIPLEYIVSLPFLLLPTFSCLYTFPV